MEAAARRRPVHFAVFPPSSSCEAPPVESAIAGRSWSGFLDFFFDLGIRDVARAPGPYPRSQSRDAAPEHLGNHPIDLGLRLAVAELAAARRVQVPHGCRLAMFLL